MSATASAVQNRFIETPSCFLTALAVPKPNCPRERREPMAPAYFGGEMPNLCCALTATSWDSGNATQPLLHPCVRPHFATNRRTRATLHDYHLRGDEVNADSERTGARTTLSLHCQCSNGYAHQLLEMGPAPPTLEGQAPPHPLTAHTLSHL